MDYAAASGSSSTSQEKNHVGNIVNLVTKLKDALKCGICHSTIKNNILTSCNHLFCEPCFKDFQRLTTKERKDLCPICSQKINRRSCQTSDFASELLSKYLQVAKSVTGELFSFDLPPQERFYESQALMTQVPVTNIRRSGPSTSTAAFKVPGLPPPSQQPSFQPPRFLGRPSQQLEEVRILQPEEARQVLQANADDALPPTQAYPCTQAYVPTAERPMPYDHSLMPTQAFYANQYPPNNVIPQTQIYPSEQAQEQLEYNEASIQCTADTKEAQTEAATSTCDSSSQCCVETCDVETQISAETRDANSQCSIQESPLEQLKKFDFVRLLNEYKASHQCNLWDSLLALFPGVVELLQSDGLYVVRYASNGNPENGPMATQAFHGNEPPDEENKDGENLDDTHPMEMSDHPSLRPPVQDISNMLGETTLNRLEDDIELDISDLNEPNRSKAQPLLTSTPLITTQTKTDKKEQLAPGVSPISQSQTKKRKRSANRNLSSIMEEDERQVSPVVLKLKRGTSVTRDPDTKKLKWEGCHYRVATGHSLEAIAEVTLEKKNDLKNKPTSSTTTAETEFSNAGSETSKNESMHDDLFTNEESDDGDDDGDVECVEDSFTDLTAEEEDKENEDPRPMPPIKISVSGKKTKRDEDLVKRFLATFPDQIGLGDPCDSSLTHLIVFNTHGKVCRKLSMKYIHALSLGLPITTQQWMVDCIKNRSILHTTNYEIEGVERMDKASMACRRSMADEKRTLLDDFWFFVPEQFFKSDTIKRDTIMEMIGACGGHLVMKPWEAKGKLGKNLIVYGTDCTDMQDSAKKFELTTNFVVVMADWVLDSICSYKVKPLLESYRLTNVHEVL
ncbi:hypothetical protein QR680_014951 [Steinernema hermaphroditum]|uniref:RING-type E3 ubiquitin transferase BRCA1 n=1 Tax=Steinernema hermaphroditum TaxID=289476 RepID=A0AA39IC77_9BILA|nr:hypothetical protein QR680_014951 [Steinernema hermaphroditum]